MFERIKRFFGAKTYTKPVPVKTNNTDWTAKYMDSLSKTDWDAWEKDFDDLHKYVRKVFGEPLPQPSEEDIANQEYDENEE